MNDAPDRSRPTRLPRHRLPAADLLPDARRPAEAGAADPRALGRRWTSGRRSARRLARAAEIHPARRPALCERQHPYRHRAEQDPQGRHQPHPPDGRLRRRLHPRLGLPRPADRVEDRGAVPRGEEGQGRGPGARFPRRVPRLCRALAGGADGGIPPPRRRGQLARSLRHHGPPVRGGDRGRDLQVPAERRAVSRPAPGAVVAGGEDRAGRGRGRVPRPHLAHGLGALPGRDGSEAGTARLRRW